MKKVRRLLTDDSLYHWCRLRAVHSLDKQSQLIRSRGCVFTAVYVYTLDVWGRLIPYRGAILCAAGWLAASPASPQ